MRARTKFALSLIVAVALVLLLHNSGVIKLLPAANANSGSANLQLQTFDAPANNTYLFCVGGGYGGPTSYYAPLTANGIGNWSSTTPVPQGFNTYGGYLQTTCTTNGNFIYCINDSDFTPSSSYYAQLSTNGGITNWQSSSPFPYNDVDIPGCVQYNNYMYCVGSGADSYGTGASCGFTYKFDCAFIKQVYYSPLTSGGMTGWSATTPYPRDVWGTECVADYGNIYCIGGTFDPVVVNNCGSGCQTGGTIVSNLAYYAPISGSGVGTWSRTTSYPINVTESLYCGINDSYVYCTQGQNIGVTYTASYYAPISSGGIGQWLPTTSYPVNAIGDGCYINGGYIYCLQTPGTFGIQSYYAPLSKAGIGKWKPTNNYPASGLMPACIVATPQYVSTLKVTVTPASALINSGQTAPQFTAFASGGKPPYSYSWSVGSNLAVVSGCTTGSTTCTVSGTNTGASAISSLVTVTAKDSVPSTATASAVVTINPPLPLKVVITPTSATVNNGQTAPQFTATASGGTTPYSYSWSIGSNLTVVSGCTTGSTTCTVSGTNLGTSAISTKVTVTATDSASHTASASATITINPQPQLVVTISPTSATINSGQTAPQFTATASGGSPPYSYKWVLGSGLAIVSGCTTSSTTCTVSGTNIGTAPVSSILTVTAIDSASRTASASATIRINQSTTTTSTTSSTTTSTTSSTTSSSTSTSTSITTTTSVTTSTTSTSTIITFTTTSTSSIYTTSYTTTSICPPGYTSTLYPVTTSANPTTATTTAFPSPQSTTSTISSTTSSTTTSVSIPTTTSISTSTTSSTTTTTTSTTTSI